MSGVIFVQFEATRGGPTTVHTAACGGLAEVRGDARGCVLLTCSVLFTQWCFPMSGCLVLDSSNSLYLVFSFALSVSACGVSG